MKKKKLQLHVCCHCGLCWAAGEETIQTFALTGGWAGPSWFLASHDRRMSSPAAHLRLKAPGSDVQLMLNTSVIPHCWAAEIHPPEGRMDFFFFFVPVSGPKLLDVCFLFYNSCTLMLWCYSSGSSFWSGHQECFAPNVLKMLPRLQRWLTFSPHRAATGESSSASCCWCAQSLIDRQTPQPGSEDWLHLSWKGIFNPKLRKNTMFTCASLKIYRHISWISSGLESSSAC